VAAGLALSRRLFPRCATPPTLTRMPTPLAPVFVSRAGDVRSAVADLRAAGLEEQADALVVELRTAQIIG